MSFLLWRSPHDGVSVASSRLVMRAAEVPPLLQADRLVAETASLLAGERERVARAGDEARARAREQGLADGRAAARDEIAATLAATAGAIAAERAALRRELATLALQVVRRMLGQFAPDEVLAALAATAAADALPAPRYTVVVHPQQVDGVRRRLAAQATQDAAAPSLDVRGDDACSPADCRIETELGSIDASLDEQLARIERAWSAVGDAASEAA